MLNDKNINSSTTKEKTYKNVDIMYETEDNSGEYTVSTDTSWPTEGYTFNTTLSKCENGSTLTWDDENNIVKVAANVSDKCYVYFDKLPPTSLADVCSNGDNLAGCIKDFYTTDGVNGLYLHDSDLTNGANDGSYRYAGTDPNNYVCFGSDVSECPYENLYRIIGVFGDQVKLIKYDAATADTLGATADFTNSIDATYYKGQQTSYAGYYWDSNGSNTWSTSSLNTTLNGTYLTNLGSWGDKIATTTWIVGGNTYTNIRTTNAQSAYNYEIVNPAESTTHSAKIGLMYVSEYYYGADPTYWTTAGSSYSSALTSNWMGMGIYEWTITRVSGYSNYAFLVDFFGGVDFGHVYIDGGIGVRPSFSLTSDVAYSGGSGSFADPYRIS